MMPRDLVTKWLIETNIQIEIAKKNVNFLKVFQLDLLHSKLLVLRDGIK